MYRMKRDKEKFEILMKKRKDLSGSIVHRAQKV
jgi:hypothetical protein